MCDVTIVLLSQSTVVCIPVYSVEPVEPVEPVGNAGQEGLPPNPAPDAGGEWSERVGNRPEKHSDGEDSEGTRYGSLMDELPDPPLNYLVQDDQTFR